MNEFVYDLIFFLVVFAAVFIYCYFFAGREKDTEQAKGKKRGKNDKLMNEGKFMILRYHLDETKIDYQQLHLGICLCNALVISVSSTIIYRIPLNRIYQLLIGFVLVFALIYSVFELYGRYLNKKWGKKK